MSMIGDSLAGQGRCQMARNFSKFLGYGISGVRLSDRQPPVARLSSGNIDGDLPEEGHLEPGGFPLSTPVSENVVALPVTRAEEVAHVLDEAEDGHVDLLEHRRRLARVDQRDLLWRSY